MLSGSFTKAIYITRFVWIIHSSFAFHMIFKIYNSQSAYVLKVRLKVHKKKAIFKEEAEKSLNGFYINFWDEGFSLFTF